MSKGQVKKYEEARGCGIIVDRDTQQQYTVYANFIKLKKGAILKTGQKVEFEIEKNRHCGKWAINVRPLEDEVA